MSTKKYLDLDGLSHVWLLVGNKLNNKVDKAYKTGSQSEYKVLSDNNLTDALVTKINNASTFSGDYDDLTNKPQNLVQDASYVHTDNNFTTTLKNKLDGIESGAEVNAIETVKVNNSALTPDVNKAVNITVPTKVSDLTNDGDGTVGSEFATKDYVDASAGAIDTIKVNGTTQTITNKTVDISVPTNNNQLTNGAGYQTASDVSTAINTAIGGITSIDYQVVQTLPASGVKGTIYLVSNSGTGTNIYDEYIWVNNAWEFIGTTAVDLTNYLQDSDVIPLTNAEIDSVCV